MWLKNLFRAKVPGKSNRLPNPVSNRTGDPFQTYTYPESNIPTLPYTPAMYETQATTQGSTRQNHRNPPSHEHDIQRATTSSRAAAAPRREQPATTYSTRTYNSHYDHSYYTDTNTSRPRDGTYSSRHATAAPPHQPHASRPRQQDAPAPKYREELNVEDRRRPHGSLQAGSSGTRQRSTERARSSYRDDRVHSAVENPPHSAPAREASQLPPALRSSAGRVRNVIQNVHWALEDAIRIISPRRTANPLPTCTPNDSYQEMQADLPAVSAPAPPNVAAPIPMRDGSNLPIRDQERSNPASRSPPRPLSRENHTGSLSASSSRIATGGQASSGIHRGDLHSQAPQLARPSNPRQTHDPSVPAPSSSNNRSQHRRTHPAGPRAPTQASSSRIDGTQRRSSDTLPNQPQSRTETPRDAIPTAPVREMAQMSSHRTSPGQGSGSSRPMPNIQTVLDSTSVRTETAHKHSSTVNVTPQAPRAPPPLSQTPRPSWVVPEGWKLATDLTIRNPISAETFLNILWECVDLQRISVILHRGDLTGSGRISAKNLEILSITTSVEPRPILDALVLPKLKTFHLEWDTSHGQSFPEDSNIGFPQLMRRSSCPLKSLSLSNIFPDESDLIKCLELRHVGKTLQELIVRGDLPSSLPPRSSGRLITGDTLSALSHIHNGAFSVCPKLRTLDISYCYAEDGQLSKLVDLRSDEGREFHIAMSFRKLFDSHQMDMSKLSKLRVPRKKWLSVRMKGAELLVTTDY